MTLPVTEAVGAPSTLATVSPAIHAWSVDEAVLRARSEMSAAERSDLDQLAFTYGTAPESYDILISDGFFLKTPCGRGVLSVLRHRHYWHIAGGIIAPAELKPQIVNWLKEISQKKRLTMAIYSIHPEEIGLFQAAGFEINKLGEEPLLDLGEITWQGKDFEWVRRQTNFCKRAGLEIVEITDEGAKHDLADELIDIMHEDLEGRTYAHPLRLLEGEFDPKELYRRRLFLARHQETGRVEGFLACSPLRDGQGWAFETYRKRKDAPRGTVPFLFRDVIDRLQKEGVSQVSLCLVPGKGTEQAFDKSSSWLARLALSMWYKRLNFLFNTQGQNYFKTRFRPRFVDRYICVTPYTTPLSISSFLYTMGAYSPHFGNILKNLWGSWRNKVPQD